MHIEVSGRRQVDVLSPVLEGGGSILYKEQLVFIFNMWYNLFLGRLSAFFTEYFLLGKSRSSVLLVCSEVSLTNLHYTRSIMVLLSVIMEVNKQGSSCTLAADFS